MDASWVAHQKVDSLERQEIFPKGGDVFNESLVEQWTKRGPGCLGDLMDLLGMKCPTQFCGDYTTQLVDLIGIGFVFDV